MDGLIEKSKADWKVAPNFTDYAAERQRFTWQWVRERLGIGRKGPINIARLAVDRHLAEGRGGKVAFRFLAAGRPVRTMSYAELARATNRFCAVLQRLGVRKGERVFVLARRIPELYVTVLGALKQGCVVSPLFSAFGPEPIATRINLGAGKVLVTTADLYRRKVAPVREKMPSLAHVLLVGEEGESVAEPATLDYAALMAEAGEGADVEVVTESEDPALLHFTSGTTGTPKGAVHVHEAVLMHWASSYYALDLHADDIFWCTADPGWVTGTSYGVIAPLLHGTTSVIDCEEFDAERWYDILASESVSVWYTAPTAIRMLMKAGEALLRGRRFPALRLIASVGEPLNPEAVRWGQAVLGLPIHDNWWQTETGGIMIANTPAFAIKPGSMGRPLPGVDAAIVRRGEGGEVVLVEQPDVEGELALRRGWPSMFRGYLGMEERYRQCFAGDWYLSGDLAKRDADGYFWFVGRRDDVIKSAGHLIGPFEVESVLMEHPAVAEAGVIGKPDAVVGEVVKAFVALKKGFEDSEALRQELLAHARKRLGAVVAPKEITVLANLPRTRSGKIMRRLLKARELGLPEGDLSTLEGGA
ncbi:MAG: acetate--CoA ligase [Rhodocyclaceae bacterium]|nr:acetate--CoA ligase [Rhodocyclaceae bacterium]